MPHGGRRTGAGRKARSKLGTPAGSSAVELFLTEKDFEKVVADLYHLARGQAENDKDRLEAIKLLLYYRDGKPRQRHEITGPDGEALFDPRDELLAKLARLAPG